MTDFNKEKWGLATDTAIELVKKLPADCLQYKPDITDAWSIHEHVIHMVDSEINAFLRLKTILGQPGSRTFIIDESEWVRKIDYEKENIEDYLDIFKLIRKVERDLILTCIKSEKDYSQNYAVHDSFGKVDINTWISWYSENHISEHLDYIKRNLENWENNQF